MARVINQTRVTEQKNRIIDTAELLFIQQGYQHTSVNKILDKLNIAKGTFYHYFTSKDNLLDQMINRMYGHFLKPISNIINDSELNAIAKFNQAINLIKTYKIERKEMMMQLVEILYREENLRWRYKIEQQSIKLVVPEFAKIIEQGNQEGVFKVEDPFETAEIFIRLSNTFTEVIAPMIIDRHIDKNEAIIIGKKIKAYKQAMERLLGVKPGILDLLDMESLEEIVT